ncbi:hypothetical protein P152DRAFT_466867 [Eremomyces bilateralis CBS 781.70]|uniref:HNH nuclease domain-containing protein n=1 Tax=Eremomyces bilateralis CBS 781.70 TaxID=1392243 RepID=A0A6G1G1Z0_9PEZI|nr:uncharacterized protein P152DRAFT_466867 [Eremomyces bilateralis CBS 781.70]KAF1812074.1 hypothetical protein P152DRAFT_466867 [Eremomyces bilateralis CBS 781.70]
MPRLDRSVGRDVHIHDANNTNVALGGLVLTPGVTNANLYLMVEILVIFTNTFSLQYEGGTKVEKDDGPLQPGKYFIVSAGSFNVTDEAFLVRTISHATGTRVASFCESVRSRDRKCVISGLNIITLGGIDIWDGFEASHIFPLAYESHWINNDYGRWVSIEPPRGGTINSVQNGILLDSVMHQLFDNYFISINPDDNYKVMAFRPNARGIGSHHLDPGYFARPDAPLDSVLRWHFRQAVLANMRGAGEPIFEHDFPPGSDIVGDILHGPRAAARMESELFGRLGAQVELFHRAKKA